MRKIYRDSFRYFLTSLPMLLGFAAMIEVALWIFQPKREFAMTFPALVILAYFFHRHFLFGETLTLTQKPTPDVPRRSLAGSCWSAV